ncbi:hypothetical protein [Nonomuraea sp. NPDC050643]|uniref:hypothetical protein n=1 Tax=Nonomuraea sp. NPDC050643 TaxID=3155660 RepID=UPI0033CC004E
MRADHIVTGAVVLAAAVVLVVYGVQHRRQQRMLRAPELGWLACPTRMPAGHPERSYPNAGVPDAAMAALADRLWPGGWHASLLCPHPELTGHLTRQEAALAADGSRRATIARCICGTFHVRYRAPRGARR